MSSPRIDKEDRGLWEHKWSCIECEKSWFLSVDLSKDRDKQRLDQFYSAVTIHTIENEHSVYHIQKEMKFSQRY